MFCEVGPNAYGVRWIREVYRAFKKDTWNTKIVDELTPAKGDVIIEGKRGPMLLGTAQP